MLTKIELDVELARPVVNRRSREPARSDVQRHVPRVVRPRRTNEADLAHDLTPQVERLQGVAPLLVFEFRPFVG